MSIELEKIITNCIRQALNQSEKTVFEKLCECFHDWWNRPCSNMLELKKRTEKEKGTLFEVFCCMYLRHKGYTVWLLSECPTEVLSNLSLTKQDVGIDLIAKITTDATDCWFPIQCKYRSPNKITKSHTLGWKTVSTFLSLCSRTGPIVTEGKNPIRGWAKHIIMTNCKSVRWCGRKTPKDWTIAQTSFNKPNTIFWSSFLSSTIKIEKKEETIAALPLSKEEIRQKRLEWLNKQK